MRVVVNWLGDGNARCDPPRYALQESTFAVSLYKLQVLCVMSLRSQPKSAMAKGYFHHLLGFIWRVLSLVIGSYKSVDFKSIGRSAITR